MGFLPTACRCLRHVQACGQRPPLHCHAPRKRSTQYSQTVREPQAQVITRSSAFADDDIRSVELGHVMQRSTDRILTTHVGSLIRPQALQDFLRAKQSAQSFDHAAYARYLKGSVAQIVREQSDVGLDIVSDGEFGKSISWNQYVLERLSGFEQRPVPPGSNPIFQGAD